MAPFARAMLCGGISSTTPGGWRRCGRYDASRCDADLLRRLQSRRVGPLVKMGGRIGAAGLSQKFVAFVTDDGLRLAARFFRKRRQPIFQGYCLYETTPYCHGAAPCFAE